MELATLAQQATDILAPALPFIYAGGIAVADKGKDILIEGGKSVIDKSKDMLLEKGIEKVGSETIDKAKSLLNKISPKMSTSLEKALEKVSKNSDDPEAMEELQQDIQKLLRENPSLAREIDITINLNIEKVENLTIENNTYNYIFKSPAGSEYFENTEYIDLKRKAVNLEILSNNPSTFPNYPETLKQFVTETLTNNVDIELLESEYLAQLEQVKENLKNKNPTEALDLIKKLENRIWDKSSSKVKYNLLKLKASANLSLHKYSEAGKLFLKARQYNSEDEKAIVNASFGYLLLGEKSKSRELALKVLERNPANDNAYSILIQTGSDEDIGKIPHYMKENQDVAYALGSHFYQKRDLDEAKKWLEISIENEVENILEIRPLLVS